MADLLQFLLTILIIALFSALGYIALRKSKKKKKLPPGPIGLPLLGILPFLSPDLHVYFAGLAEKYGPIMSLKLGTKLFVIVSSSSAAMEVLKEKDAVFAFRDVPITAAIITKGGADVGWNNDAASWRFLRKIVVRELLSSTSMDEFSRFREREMRSINKELYERRGEKVLIWQVSFQVLQNLILGMFWGETLEGDERESVAKEFREVIHGITQCLGYPNVSDFFPALAPLDLQGVGRRMKKIASWCDEVLDRVIDKRLKLAGDRDGDGAGRGKDFLQLMVDIVQKKETELPLTIDHVKGVFLDIVTAATDTTTSTVEFAMAEMMGKREVLEKVKSELDSVVGNASVVQESHLPHLHNLNAVLKETLRLHPALPLMVPHTPIEPSDLGEYHIPTGSRVLINVWAIHRDASAWENPSEFRPERFLRKEEGLDYNASRNGFQFLPFGSGRRTCPGIPMADKMGLYLLATMLHSFDWELPPGDKVDTTGTIGIVLKMAKPLIAIPMPRLSSIDLYT